MDQSIMDSLRNWKTMSRNEHSEEAGHHLHAVLQYAAEIVRKNDRQELDEIRYRLEQTVAAEKPADAASYYLGVAQGMLDWLNVSLHIMIEEDMQASLSDLERQLLQCIAENSRITPSQIMKAAHIDNKQHVSNLLSKLRAKELVSYWQAGKNRWYKVTNLGLKVLSELQTDQHHAAAGSKQLLSDGVKRVHAQWESLLSRLSPEISGSFVQTYRPLKMPENRMIPIHFQYNDNITAAYRFGAEPGNIIEQWYAVGDQRYNADFSEEEERHSKKVNA